MHLMQWNTPFGPLLMVLATATVILDLGGVASRRTSELHGRGGMTQHGADAVDTIWEYGVLSSGGAAALVNISTVQRDIWFSQKTYVASVREDAEIRTYVLTLRAFYQYGQTLAESDFIVYSVKQKKKNNRGRSKLPFSVNKKTGEVFVSKALKPGSYNFLGYARDKRQPNIKAISKIKIRITELGQFKFASEQFEGSIQENSIGRVNASLSVMNTRMGLTPRFSLQNVTPHDGYSIFDINSTTGYVWALRSLDREYCDRYVLTIVGMCGEEVAEVHLVLHILDVNDNPPVFPYDILRMYVYENANVSLSGETVVNATDIDEGDNAIVTYRILQGARGIIEVDPGSGQLFNRYHIDYERIKRFRLLVAAYSGNLFSTARVFIHVIDRNDNAPEVPNFEMFYNGLPDAILSGTEVGRISARDIDREGNLRFIILPEDREHVAGSSETTKPSLLQVDSVTGSLSFRPKVNRLEVSEENQKNTEVTIFVSDGVHGRTARCRVELTSVSEEMLRNSVNLRLPSITQDAFLQSGGIGKLRIALSEVLDVTRLHIFNIREMSDNGQPAVNISFAARNSENVFLSPKQIVNTLYFQLDQLQRLCGLVVIPAEDDGCLTETCGSFQRCRIRKTHTGGSSVSSLNSKTSVTFHGINPSVVQWCECPHPHTSNNCSEPPLDVCDSNPCLNGATCQQDDEAYTCICPTGFAGANCEVDFARGLCFAGACKHRGVCVNHISGGFRCYCRVGFDGERCEMTARYFPSGAYMAFPTITQRSSVIVSLNFSTLQTDGLIMYIGRYSQQHDFFAVEIISSQVAFSFAVGRLIMRVMVGTPGGVSDGDWHVIRLEYREKVVQVLLDACALNEEDSQTTEELSNYPCIGYATQAVDVTTWFIDVNTPLLVGSLPAQQQETRLLSETFIGCIKDVKINNRLLDFAESLIDYRTEPGCRISRYR